MAYIRLSVLVPVYKVEEYIEKCARSLFEQTMKEGMEYIFIDDCTPDRSIEVLCRVLDEYPERKNQVRILHNEENLSTAGTRTRCLKEAQGEYVIFCDADDWIDLDMYERMYSQVEQNDADIVTCNYIRHTPTGLEPVDFEYESNPRSCVEHLYRNEIFPFSPLWNKLIRRQIFVDHDCYPYEGINLSEDLNVLVRVFCYAKSLVKMDDYFYHVNRLNMGSITKSQKDWRGVWGTQYKNVSQLEKFLTTVDSIRFRITINNLKFYTKSWFREEFSDREYFMIWKESYCDILHFKTTPIKGRILMYFAYSNYCFFKLFTKMTRHSK